MSQKKIVLLFPNMLFPFNESPIIKEDKKKENQYLLIEDPLFFSDKARIKSMSGLKLLLHRVSMKIYEEKMKEAKFNITYINFNDALKYNYIKSKSSVETYNPVDHLLVKRINQMVKKSKANLNIVDTPLFICKTIDFEDYKNKMKGKKILFFQTSFYQWQRQRLNILMDNGKYEGGKLTYDNQNRKSMPSQGLKYPKYHDSTKLTKYKHTIEEAQKYIKNTFKNNYYGNLENYHYMAFDTDTAKLKLNDFLKNRFHMFGDYQDAMDKENSYMFHSLLASAINIGIITPKFTIDSAIEYYNSKKKIVGINNVEGFVRQILGWREYYRFVYHEIYDDLIKSNVMQHTNKLSVKWYNGTTGIKPIDDCIKKAFDTGYLHHIERLMVVGQFMLLCRIHPAEIYKWFMEFSTDSYDWVMVGNCYGMVGYSSGGQTTTKPYISSSNYILKMSNWEKDGYWDKLWRSMYYSFIDDYESVFKQSRNHYMIAQKNKLSASELKEMKNETYELIKNITKK